MNEVERLIAKSVLRKLYSAGCWGKGHLLVDRLKSGIPSHLRGNVKEALTSLIKEGLVIVYGRTKHGVAVHLNIAKKEEIEQIVLKGAND